MNHDGQTVAGHARKNSAGPIIVTVLIFGLAYALLRNHVAGSVPWNEFSLHTLNKGFSLSAFILITCSFSIEPLINLGINLPETWFKARKALGMTGFLLVLIHALLSLVLFNPMEFPGLFEPDGRLTLLAGLSVLCGILAVVMLSAYNLSFQTFLHRPGGHSKGEKQQPEDRSSCFGHTPRPLIPINCYRIGIRLNTRLSASI